MLYTERFISHGLDCAAVRTPTSHWCGYVAVPPSHPLHGKHYSDHVHGPKEELSLSLLFDVHGGLTYCGATVNTYPAYVPGVWWFGFDCAHYGDRENPKNLPYVINELKGLARQLAEYVPEPPLAITHQPSAEQVV